MKIKQKRKTKIFKVVVFNLFLLLILFSLFVNKNFNNISFEQLLSNVTDVKGANFEIVFKGFIFIFLRMSIVNLVLGLLYKFYKKSNINIYIKIGIKDNIKKIKIFNFTKLKENILFTIFLIFSIYYSVTLFNVDEFIKSQLKFSLLFEDNYVSAKDVKLKFPKEKRNLIYIYVESLESTNISKNNGGLVKESYIPNLEKIALENINFSNTEKIGGALPINNTTWTMAALVAHTSGIPLKLNISTNDYKSKNNYLPGVYNLGDILLDNGYNNYFMIGSDAEFGGRKDYFKKHGKYIIYDYISAKKENLIDDDYFVWWGYEDSKLFEFAKDKLEIISRNDEPFNFTLLTVDTHFTDGYMDKDCVNKFDSEYANAFYCSDAKIYNFIKWIQKQDFYKNTTIIISGDHLTMQSNFYEENSNYQRTIYNTFINSKIEPKKEKNRLFTSFDMFPTTLASLGVEIEGNRLGLGVNLFSLEETLIEKYGYEFINEEITKKSNYYDNKILKNIEKE